MPAMASQLLPVVVFSSTTAEDIVTSYAIKYGTSPTPLIATLRCESNLRADAVGDFGTSYGISQIHLPAHKNVTKAQALDPFFSIDFAAHEFSLGHQYMWSCWKSLYSARDS